MEVWLITVIPTVTLFVVVQCDTVSICVTLLITRGCVSDHITVCQLAMQRDSHFVTVLQPVLDLEQYHPLLIQGHSIK